MELPAAQAAETHTGNRPNQVPGEVQMSGYFEGFGAKEAKRERLVHRILLAVVILTVAGGISWYFLRNYRENRQTDRFFALLEARNYPEAYKLWGCSVENPCRNYNYDKFMADWGPKSPAKDPSKIRVANTRSCDTGIIKILRLPNGEQTPLWVERKDLTIGFAPWTVCNPRVAVSSSITP